MQAWIVTLLVGAPIALGGGWFAAVLPDDVAGVAARANAMPQVDHAGLQTRAAVADFVALGMPRQPPAEEAITAAAPLAVATPIEDQLARDLTAVLGKGKVQRLLVVDRDSGDARREIKLGQEFREGWILKEIRSQAIVLSLGGEDKVVPLFGAADPAQIQAAMSRPAQAPMQMQASTATGSTQTQTQVRAAGPARGAQRPKDATTHPSVNPGGLSDEEILRGLSREQVQAVLRDEDPRAAAKPPARPPQ